MTNVIGVRFRTGSRIYYFDPGDYDYSDAEGVIVETSRGTEYGELVQKPHEVPDETIVQPLKEIIRIATENDYKTKRENEQKEVDAFQICQNKIAKHGLDMKLVGVEYAFDKSKVIFYFTAAERVDFRELVKDLASEFRTRIELRQIGVRDEAKLLGGLGPCGRPVCCKTFLDDFRPVSIKMAKEQNLSLNQTKISGLCGRLMCCLQYEQAAYEEIKSKMPKIGKEIQTPDGIGIAAENNAVTERTKVKMVQDDGTIEFREYHYTQLCPAGDKPLEAAVAKFAETEKKAEEDSTAVRLLKTTPVGAYVPPEIPVDSHEQKQERKDKKRRYIRKGRKGDLVKSESGKPEKDKKEKPASKESGQPKKSRNSFRRRRKSSGNNRNDYAKPVKEN